MTKCNCCDEEISQDADSVWVAFGPRDIVVFVCGKDDDCVGDELILRENMVWNGDELAVRFDGEDLYYQGNQL